METAILAVDSEDRQIIETWRDAGHVVTIVKEDRFDGIGDVLQVVVAVTPLVVPLLMKFLTERSKARSARSLTVQGRTYRFKGFNEREIRSILETLANQSEKEKKQD